MDMRCLKGNLTTKSYATSKLTKTCLMFIFKDSFQCYFNEFCDVMKMAIIHKEDLSKFGYKLNMKGKIYNHFSIYILVIITKYKVWYFHFY